MYKIRFILKFKTQERKKTKCEAHKEKLTLKANMKSKTQWPKFKIHLSFFDLKIPYSYASRSYKNYYSISWIWEN
jgi:hypothetical protein